MANETSAIIQFKLTQLLCYISPEERAAVKVKIEMPGKQFHQMKPNVAFQYSKYC